MPASSHFKELLQSLNDRGVKYLVVGAYAVMKYTEPRYTKDLDIWVEPTQENAELVFQTLAEFGAPMKDVTPNDFANHELVFQIGLPPHRIDIMMGIPPLEFPASWNRRVTAQFDEVAVNFLSRDDLLRAKRSAGRPQDLLDADLLLLSKQVDLKNQEEER